LEAVALHVIDESALLVMMAFERVAAQLSSVPILKFCAFHPNALVPQGAAKRPRKPALSLSKGTLQYAPVRAPPSGASFETRDFASLLEA
jgi:hypothetical protein